MRFSKITLEKFKGFHRHQTFLFPRQPGVYYMTGENREKPELGANAVGKSTLWDAVCWCLYGKTVRGLKAGDISSWRSKKPGGVMVQLTVEAKGKVITIRRTWKPNSLMLVGDRGNKNIEQPQLERLIGMEYPSFLNSVVFGQFNDTFLDLDPTKKEAVLCSALGLNVYLDYSKAAGAYASDLAREERDNYHELGRVEGDFGNTVRQLEDLEPESIGIKEEESALKRDLKKLETSKQGLLNRIDKAVKKSEHLPDAIEELEGELSEHREAKDNLQRRKQELSLRIEADEKQLKMFEQSKGNCPTCGQHLSRMHRESETTRLMVRMQDYWDEMQGIDASIATLTENSRAISSKIRKLESSLSASDKALGSLEDRLVEVSASIREKESNLSTIASWESKRQDKIAALEARYRSLRRQLSNLEINGADLRDRYQFAKFWVTGFRELRLMLMEDALGQLQRVVNSVLHTIGLGDWELTFSTKRINKKGDATSARLEVLVKAPLSEEKVPWESWSGGESQRLRLAGAIALSELIAAETGSKLQVEAWDEPTNWLSPEGVEQLVEVLRERAVRERKVIWLCDHRTLSGNFTGSWKVVRDTQGSFIEKVY